MTQIYTCYLTFLGRHTVEILYAGQAVMGSPFFVEIYDPNKLRVEGHRVGVIGDSMGIDGKLSLI